MDEIGETLIISSEGRDGVQMGSGAQVSRGCLDIILEVVRPSMRETCQIINKKTIFHRVELNAILEAGTWSLQLSWISHVWPAGVGSNAGTDKRLEHRGH